jgi:motility quorum-sensing regulator/GCU-specific mRNA interferase toxin
VEKRRAHYDLRAIQAQMSTVDGLRMTVTARHDALRAGVTLPAAVSVIQSLSQVCFYKSMTTHQDHDVWQDVYHGSWRGKRLYIKFQQDAAGYFTISFKEL